MTRTAKKRRLHDGTSSPKSTHGGRHPETDDGAEPHRIFPGSPSAPATREDQANWRGFCEIESEPAFFNYILRNYGVKGLKVQEVFGLDPEMLALLPRPVHGLIFLFRYMDDSSDLKETPCPRQVWFANQTSGNSCASMALLNIVNNIPDANLGEHLQAFKDITKDLSPALRGDQISNFTFVRNVHNSFARKIEMLTTDLDLQQDFANSKNKRKGKIAYSYDDAPFHFIAFVPVNEQVWQLDGLNGQPYNLGAHGPQDWLNLAVPVIKSRMQVYDQESIQFALLAVTPDPTTKIEQALESTFLTIQRVHERLDLLDDTWKQHPLQYSHYNELDVRNGIEENPEAKKHAKISPADVERLSTDSTEDLFAFRKELLVSQADLVKQLKDEIASHATDEAQAEGRQYDYNPAIKTWMTMLAENGTLQELS